MTSETMEYRFWGVTPKICILKKEVTILMKRTFHRLLNGLLILTMLFILFPISAFAAPTSNIDITAAYKSADDNGAALLSRDGTGGKATGVKFIDVTPNDRSAIENSDTTTTIDLWVTTKDMQNSNSEKGKIVPYLRDNNGTLWYLKEIVWNTTSSGPDESDKDAQTILSADAIKSASATNDISSSYMFNISSLNKGTNSKYYIQYWWTKESPYPDVPPAKSYTVKYDLNQGTGDNRKEIFPIRAEGESNWLDTWNDGITYDSTKNESLGLADSKKADGVTFEPGSTICPDFFAYKYDRTTGKTTYYKFDGWKDARNNIYNKNSTLTVSENISGNDNIITLTANWTEIDNLSDQSLNDAKKEIALDILQGDSSSIYPSKDSTYPLMAQWTQENLNEIQGKKTDADVELDESGSIYYQLAFKMFSNIAMLGSGDSRQTADFSEFEISINIDDKLLLNDQTESVKFLFNCAFLTPTDVKVNNQSITPSITKNDSSNSYEIAVTTTDLVNSETQSISDFSILVKWRSKDDNGNLISYTTDTVQGPIKLSIPALKLKTNDSGIVVNKDFHIETSANITGQMDLNLLSYPRIHYTIIKNILDNTKAVDGKSKSWTDYFEGGSTNTVAFAHAAQFFDWAASNYNLSDTDTVHVDLAANTVVATYPQRTYKVIHQYFTNGTLDGTYEETEEAIYVGDTVTASSIVQCPEYEGNTYTYTSAAPNSITISKEADKNVLTLRYDRHVASHKYYTLQYNTNGGEKISSETKSHSWTKDYEALPVPVRDGWVFDGWYLDKDLTDAVTGDVKVNRTTVTIYAKWDVDMKDPDNTGVSDWLNTKDHNAYLHGYPSGLFGPDRDMTRAEVAQMFYNLLLDQNVAVTVQFADVPADAWYAKPVNTLASLGILKGVGEDRFEPQRSITRAEFTTIAMRFSDLKEGGENIFSDVEPEDWFYDQVVGSIQYGWIGGYEDGTFRPDNTITRAEVTAITNRMLGRAADEAYVTAHKTDLRQFPDLTEIHWGYYHVMEATNAHDYTKENGTEDWKGLKT